MQRDYDVNCLFSAPVAEKMDFHTIEEHRLPQYVDISELQDDLIITFKYVSVLSSKKHPFANLMLILCFCFL